MPSYLDLGLLAVVLISALLAMLRGFTREVLAIASWGAAAIAAVYLHPLLLPYLRPYISKDVVAMAAAAGIVFFITLVVVSLVTVRLSDAILDSKVGALDRSLGFVFGAVRGLLLCVVAPPLPRPREDAPMPPAPLLLLTGCQTFSRPHGTPATARREQPVTWRDSQHPSLALPKLKKRSMPPKLTCAASRTSRKP